METKPSGTWKLVIQKLDTHGALVEERISCYENDEIATDAMIAADEAVMGYEVE